MESRPEAALVVEHLTNTGPEPFTSLYWIAQVQVDQPATGPVIIAFGDSIARGDGTSTDQDQRYPGHLQQRLLTSGLDGVVVLNAGHGGNRLLRPVAGPSMTDRYARDVADPDHPTRLNPAHDSGDGIDPADSGARALAEAIDLTLLNT